MASGYYDEYVPPGHRLATQRLMTTNADWQRTGPLQLLDVPTGLGKTAAVVLAWLYRRRFAEKTSARQRRAVWCIVCRCAYWSSRHRCDDPWLGNLGLFTDDPAKREVTGWAKSNGNSSKQPIAVHLLMGGEEQTDWALWPERDAILIGTQDMLLSRALNRGYAARRARWPIEFGLLHNDCLWVFDEVQLMGSGLATTAQLDAFAKKLWKPAKPSRFLWMSATMGDSFSANARPTRLAI